MGRHRLAGQAESGKFTFHRRGYISTSHHPTSSSSTRTLFSLTLLCRNLTPSRIILRLIFSMAADSLTGSSDRLPGAVSSSVADHPLTLPSLNISRRDQFFLCKAESISRPSPYSLSSRMVCQDWTCNIKRLRPSTGCHQCMVQFPSRLQRTCRNKGRSSDKSKSHYYQPLMLFLLTRT